MLGCAERTCNVRFQFSLLSPSDTEIGMKILGLLLHAATHSPLQKFMSTWLPQLETLPEARRVRWSIDVDALDLS